MISLYTVLLFENSFVIALLTSVATPLKRMGLLAMRKHIRIRLERARTIRARVQVDARVRGQMFLFQTATHL